MELQDYMRVFRQHWLAIVVATLAGAVLAFGWTLTQPKVYTATGSAIVSVGSSSSVGDALVGNNLATSRVKSYLDIAKSRKVAEYAAAQLGTNASPDSLIGMVTVTNPLDTAILRVAANGSTPEEAEKLAEAWIAGMTQVVAEIESSSGDSVIRLQTLDSAVAPSAPSSPNVKLAVALGLLVGLAFGIAYALVRAAVDRRLRSAEQIEREFDIAVLGTIPFDADIAKNGVAAADRDFHTAEGVRQLRTNLQFLDVDNPPRIVVVTSALPGDGKSTVSIKLAEAIAESGQKVILVDADLRRPSLAEYMGLVPGVGLTDVLVGRALPDEVIQAYGDTGRYFVMGAGSTPPNPSELLGSATMKNMLNSLDGNAIILIDTPPLIPVTDAAILTARTDGALVVVRSGKTTIDLLDKALQNLERVKGRPLGIILDGVSRKGEGKYYGREYRYDAALNPRKPQKVRGD
jgi:capsular exopolysaccharide synthesis family protein